MSSDIALTGQDLIARPIQGEEIAEFYDLAAKVFFTQPDPDARGRYLSRFGAERFHGVFHSGHLIGGGGAFTRRITLPGSTSCNAAAMTGMAVAASHRRRGALTTLLREQLCELHRDGTHPISVLLASEGSIYGRFGYGVASQQAKLTVPAGTPFRPGTTGDDPLDEPECAPGDPYLTGPYDAVAAVRVGYLHREKRHWEQWMGDPGLRFATHPEGYAAFRVTPRFDDRGPACLLTVHELVAASPRAYRSLWRHLLATDLVTEITVGAAASDEPLANLLADIRACRKLVRDNLWVRLVDLPGALTARRYARPMEVVLEVSDRMCPSNEGRWRLAIDDEGRAEVALATHLRPHLRLDIGDLGAIFLGGTRLGALAAASVSVEVLDAAAARHLSAAFAEDREPHCPEIF